MHQPDSLQRFIFEHLAIRGEIVHLDATWRAVLEQRDYPGQLRDLLGEFMAAAALLSATIKFSGSLILQVRGHGPVSLLMVECTSERAMRAIAHWDGDIPSAPLSEILGNGQLVMTIDTNAGQERYQGVVALNGNSVAEVLEHYFAQSEQLDTRLWLTANPYQAAGMLLQKSPDSEPEDVDAWPRLVRLGSTLTQNELLNLPTPELLHRLYHEEDVRLFSRNPVSFRCSCTRARVTKVLRMLGHQEVKEIIKERGNIQVECEFCGQRYEFDRVDAEELFASHFSSPPSATTH
jgi:molecular chaperone Hsp33